MAVFGLSITTGTLVSTITRTAALAAGGFDSAAIAAGAAVPEGVVSALHNLNTLYPMILCIVITAILLFVYPLNDRKVAEIQKEIAARDAAAAATV
jgi:Na+/melibiose symporter-like transporter